MSHGSFAEFDSAGRLNVLCSVAVNGVEPAPLGPMLEPFFNWYVREARTGKIGGEGHTETRVLGYTPTTAYTTGTATATRYGNTARVWEFNDHRQRRSANSRPRTRPRLDRRLPPEEQISQHDGIVVHLVMGRIHEGDPTMPRKGTQLIEENGVMVHLRSAQPKPNGQKTIRKFPSQVTSLRSPVARYFGLLCTNVWTTHAAMW